MSADRPGTAASVFSALTGGSNPSTVVAQRATEQTNETEDDTTAVSSGQALGQTGTPGTRPGWGCGDTNHVHTGPPGGPTTTPPGCANAP